MKQVFKIAILIVIAILCMADYAGAEEIEKKPTYKIVHLKSGKYKTSFRKNGRIFYSVKTRKKPKVRFVSTEKLTADMLEHRKSKTIIYVERDFGVVLNKSGDGQDRLGYYISYKRVRGIKFGTLVRSYFVYDPNNNYIDGIEGRCDYIVRK